MINHFGKIVIGNSIHVGGAFYRSGWLFLNGNAGLDSMTKTVKYDSGAVALVVGLLRQGCRPTGPRPRTAEAWQGSPAPKWRRPTLGLKTRRPDPCGIRSSSMGHGQSNRPQKWRNFINFAITVSSCHCSVHKTYIHAALVVQASHQATVGSCLVSGDRAFSRSESR
jgi:hypothetical protein